MLKQYKPCDDELFFVTLTVAGLTKVFARPEYAELFLERLRSSIQHEGLRVYAFCIMPSHVLLLVGVDEDLRLDNVLNDLQHCTAHSIYALIEAHARESRRDWLLRLLHFYGSPNGQPFAFWESGSQPLRLQSVASVKQVQEYIHQEPVQSWLVDEASNYPFSSAAPDCSVPLTAQPLTTQLWSDDASLCPLPSGSKPLRGRY